MKKKILAFVLCISMICSCITPVRADGEQEGTQQTTGEQNNIFASGFCGAEGENVTWTLYEDTWILVIQGTGAMDTFQIDEHEPGYSEYCTQIAEVQIEEGVTSVGEQAFYQYPVIYKVTIADTVTSIGKQAFYGCQNLGTVVMPDGIDIGESSFEGTPWKENPETEESQEETEAETEPETEAETETETESEPVESTESGENKDSSGSGWSFVAETGTLTISNPSLIAEDDPDGRPWNVSPKFIKKLVIAEGGSRIGSYWFSGYSQLQEIVIPDSIVSIGQEAFSRCSALTEFTIPASVERINDYAFAYTGLTSVTIPSTVKYLDSRAFGYCSNLVTVEITGSTRQFDRPFYGTPWEMAHAATAGVNGDTRWEADTETGELIISGNGEMDPTEGGGAPWDELAPLIKSVVIQSGVKNIAGSSFENFINLESVVIGDTVEQIGESAFCGCTSLTEVVLPDSVTEIGYAAFGGCTALQSINIPEKVTVIESCAFEGCYKLTEIVIPDSVKKIGEWVFGGCVNLEDITIGTGVEEVDSSAFCDTPWYAGYLSENNWLIINTVLVRCNISSEEEILTVTVPDGVTSISRGAFADCYGVKTVVLPDSLKVIGTEAFAGSYLYSITIPDSVVTIGERAFSGTYLSKITIPDSVKTIGSEAFYYCSMLSEITIPEDVILGRDVFAETGWYVEQQNEGNMAILNGHLLRYFGSASELTIPAEVKYIEQRAFMENEYLQTVVIPEAVISIGDFAFQNCVNLTNVTISSGTKLGVKVFEDTPYGNRTHAAEGTCGVDGGDNLRWNYAEDTGVLTISGNGEMDETNPGYGRWEYFTENITEIVVEEGVTGIGRGAFMNCFNLTKVTLPSTLQTLDAEVFCYCSSLTSVEIPDGVTAVNYASFAQCTALKTVTLPASAAKIGEMAFYGSGLETITIPENVTSIGLWAFSGTNLKEVTIPAGVTAVKEETFAQCTSLEKVIVNSTSIVFDRNAFTGCTNLQEVIFGESTVQEQSEPVLMAAALEESSVQFAVPMKVEYRSTVYAAADDVADNSAAESSGGEIIFSKGVFSGCSSLRKINFPDNVTKLGTEVFKDCTSLEEIIIPAGVKSIGAEAFASCTSLKTIVIPASVTSIAADAFKNCEELTIFGETGSAADKFAEDNGLEFTEVISDEKVEVTGITLDKSTLSLYAGKSAQLKATVEPETASDKTVVWTSSNEKVATVNAQGQVTAVGNGTAEITAKSSNGKEAVCSVTVTTPVDSISLDKSTLSLYAGKSAQLKATVEPETASDKTVVWTSSNEKVAAVSGGKVTAKAAGTAVITASCSGKTASCSVVVAPAKPSGLKAVSAGYDKIKISWKKVSGAAGYRIYCKNSKGEWKSIGTTEKTSFEHKKLKTGTTYSYMVKAYIKVNGKNIYGLYDTKGVSAKPVPATPKLKKLTNKGNNLTLTWSKTAGADGYYVYRKVPGGIWSRIAAVKKTAASYTDKNLKPGKYTYTVVAYCTVSGKKIKGKYDSKGLTKSILPSAPKLKGTSVAKGSITVKWSKVSHASGYYVYRKSGKGDWKKIAVVKGGSKVSCKDTSVKKGTVYTYRIYAYSNTGNSKVTGSCVKKGVSAKAK